MQFRFAALLYGTAVLAPFTASAQQRTTGANPADSSIAVPAIKCESAFTDYLPFRDEEMAPWRNVSDEAARVGGHCGIAGGVAGHAGHGATKPTGQPSAPVSTLPAPPASPMKHDGSHEGMKK